MGGTRRGDECSDSMRQFVNAERCCAAYTLKDGDSLALIALGKKMVLR